MEMDDMDNMGGGGIKLPRCANGTRRNKVTRECEPVPHTQTRGKDTRGKDTRGKDTRGKVKARCARGTRRNKVTGACMKIKTVKGQREQERSPRRKRMTLRKAYRSPSKSSNSSTFLTPAYSSSTRRRANKKYTTHVRAIRDRATTARNKLMKAYSDIKKARKAVEAAAKQNSTLKNNANLITHQRELSTLIASIPKLEMEMNRAYDEYMALPVMHTPAWSDEHRAAAKYILKHEA
jgi:hypothetical protein